MTKEDILRAFLADDLFVTNNYLRPGEADSIKWYSPSNKKLIEVLKIAIDGEVSNESQNITEKKINQLLNQ